VIYCLHFINFIETQDKLLLTRTCFGEMNLQDQPLGFLFSAQQHGDHDQRSVYTEQNIIHSNSFKDYIYILYMSCMHLINKDIL